MAVPIKDRGKKFSKEYQPSIENKLKGKIRINTLKEALTYFGNQLKTNIQINGLDVELTFESNIAYKLMGKANDGDLKAIELLSKMMPNWLQASKHELKTDIGSILYKEVIR